MFHAVRAVFTPGPLGGFGLFGAGQDGTGTLASTEKYFWATDVVAAGTVLGLARAWLAAAGNLIVGIFSQGSTTGLDPGKTNYTDRYTFASDTVAPGQIMVETVFGSAAAGNTTLGIWAGGQDVFPLQRTRKYTYAADAQAPGNNLLLIKSMLAAAGTLTKGYFAAGETAASALTKSVDIYTYATDGVAAGTALANAARKQLTASGNQTIGKYRGGFIAANSQLSDIYTYATDVTAASLALSLANSNSGPGGAANPTYGMTAGGGSAIFLNNTVKNAWATDTDVAGTNLIVARQRLAGVSSNPGHF